MPTITHTDYLVQVSGAGLVAVPGVWVRLLNNSTATNYYSTAVTTSTGAFTHSAVPGDYSAFYGTAATVPGTPTLANAHWAVPVTAGDDAVLGSGTIVVSGPYSPSPYAVAGANVVNDLISAVNPHNVKAYGAKGDTKSYLAGAMTNTLSTLTDTTNNPFVATDVGKKIDIYPTVLLTPVPDAFDYITTGGSLAAGTYYYRISATNASGQTLASGEVSVVVPTGTATNQCTVGWFAVTGATGYKIYGRTANAELLIASVGAVTTYTDTGAITPSGALPGSNTTANSAMTLSGLTITGYTSSSIVTVSSPATATVAGQSYSFGTDDTAALNAVAGSNRKVVLPPGTYWLSGTWSWSSFSNFIIQGEGKGTSVIRRGNAVNLRMIDLLGSNKFVVRELGLDQNGVTNSGSTTSMGIYVDFNCNDGRIEGNSFTNSPGFAVFLFGGPGLFCYNLRIWNNDVLCLDGATYDVINALSKSGSTCFNRISPGAALAINIYEARDHPCIGNTVAGSGQGCVGIRVSSSLGCPVTGNTIIVSGNDYGIQVLKETDNARATPQTQALIAANSIRGSGGSIAIGLANCSGVEICDNLIDGGVFGINAVSGSPSDVRINNNRFLDIGNSVLVGTFGANLYMRDNAGYNPDGTQAVGWNGTIVPNLANGNDIAIGAMTGTTTINDTQGSTHPPGQLLTLHFLQDGTGGRAVVWNGVYKTAWQPAQAANAASSIMFACDGTNFYPVGNQVTVDQTGNAAIQGAFITNKDRRISKQSPAHSATPAPDPTLGEIFAPGLMTANVAVANPVNSVQGQRLLMIWTQDGTGTRTITYSGTNWRSVGIAATVTTATTVTIDEAVCVDGTIWRVNRLVTGQTV